MKRTKILSITFLILISFSLFGQTNLLQKIKTYAPQYIPINTRSVTTVYSEVSGLTYDYNFPLQWWKARGVTRLPDAGDSGTNPFEFDNGGGHSYNLMIEQCGSGFKTQTVPRNRTGGDFNVLTDFRDVIFISNRINGGENAAFEHTYTYDYIKTCFVEQNAAHQLPEGLQFAFNKSTKQYDGIVRNYGLYDARIAAAGTSQNSYFDKRRLYSGLFYNVELRNLQIGKISYKNWRSAYPFTRNGCTYCDTSLYSVIRTGTPDDDYLFRLQNIQMKMRTGQRLRIAWFGDSNTEVDGRLFNSFVQKLEKYKTISGVFWSNSSANLAMFTTSTTGTVGQQDNSPNNTSSAEYIAGYRFDMLAAATLRARPIGFKAGTLFNQIKIVTSNGVSTSADVSINASTPTSVTTFGAIGTGFQTTTLNFTAAVEQPEVYIKVNSGQLNIVGIYYLNNAPPVDQNFVDLYNFSNSAAKLVDYTETGTFTNLCNTNQLPANIDAFLINYGSNDFGYITGNEQDFNKRVIKFCDKLKSCYPTGTSINSPDICLIASAHPDGTLAAATGSQTITQENYTNVLYSIANNQGYGFINLFNLIPNWREFYNKGYAGDYIHYSGNGGKVGELIFDKITQGMNLQPISMPILGQTSITRSGATSGSFTADYERINMTNNSTGLSLTQTAVGDYVKVYFYTTWTATTQAGQTTLTLTKPFPTAAGNFSATNQATGSVNFALSNGGTGFDITSFKPCIVQSANGGTGINIHIPNYTVGASTTAVVQGFYLYKL
jgi:hypothetical protein